MVVQEALVLVAMVVAVVREAIAPTLLLLGLHLALKHQAVAVQLRLLLLQHLGLLIP